MRRFVAWRKPVSGVAAGKAESLYAAIKAEGLKRMAEGGKTAGRGRPKQGVEKSPHPITSGPKSRDQLGKAFAAVVKGMVDVVGTSAAFCP